jgi:hypothetical protein
MIHIATWAVLPISSSSVQTMLGTSRGVQQEVR